MADPWINSLVQSPLVRTLNSVPSKSTSFVHGIADNVPPFSMDKVRVNYIQGVADGTGEQYRFRIPQNGYWNRAYLKLYITKTRRTANILTPTGSVTGTDFAVSGTGVLTSASNAARIVKEVSLQAHNKVIARLYGDTILARMQRLPEDQKRIWGHLMRGYGSVQPLSVGQLTVGNSTRGKIAWPYNVSVIAAAAAGAGEAEPTASANAVVYVPLPFFCFQSLAHNFQTRFVEDLELWLTKKTLAEITSVIPGVTSVNPELVCVFHTFHDTIENAIRNKNYKRGVPASILAYDDIEETEVVTNTSIPADDGTCRATATFKLRSNHLVSEIILMHSGPGLGQTVPGGIYATTPNLGRTYGVGVRAGAGTNGSATTIAYGDYTPLQIELTGSGRTLWLSDGHETLADSVPYFLNTQAPINYGVPLLESNANNATTSASHLGADQPSTAAVANPGATTAYGWNSNEFGSMVFRHLYDNNNTVLRFAFDGNDSIHSGGLALQSIADPRLTVTFSSPTTASATVSAPYIKCYVKYRCLVRIDSDTGIITRTMDV